MLRGGTGGGLGDWLCGGPAVDILDGMGGFDHADGDITSRDRRTPDTYISIEDRDNLCFA